MTDAMLAREELDPAARMVRADALRRFQRDDLIFKGITRISAWAVLALLGGIILTLVVGAWPAMRVYGIEFLWTQRWAPQLKPQPILGALGPLYGTLLTSFIAMLIAVPVGLGIAIFLTELCPQRWRAPIAGAIVLLMVTLWRFKAQLKVSPLIENY